MAAAPARRLASPAVAAATVNSPAGGRAGRWSWRLLALLAVALAFLSVRACEKYVLAYQALPALDWVETLPGLDQSRGVPPARDLAGYLAASAPQFGASGELDDYRPLFTTPGIFIRGVGGVRDGATSAKATPGDGEDRVYVRLYVTVFHRAERARAWSELRAIKLDLAREALGEVRQLRVSGPDERDIYWVQTPSRPSPGDAQVTAVGYRGPVAFELEDYARVREVDTGDPLDQSARLETIARGVVADWTAMLVRQPFARGW